MKPTKTEKQAQRIANSLLAALIAVEKFPGDPDLIKDRLPVQHTITYRTVASTMQVSEKQAEACISTAHAILSGQKEEE